MVHSSFREYGGSNGAPVRCYATGAAQTAAEQEVSPL